MNEELLQYQLLIISELCERNIIPLFWDKLESKEALFFSVIEPI